MDLFDWLDIIKKLREEGLTQAQIGDRIGWSREQVRNYIFVLDKVGTEVLDLARKHQNGRVPKNGTIVPFDLETLPDEPANFQEFMDRYSED